jgi:hypothetical protein
MYGKSYKIINQTGTIADVEGAISDLIDLKGEMEEWRDSLSDKFSGTEKYQTVEACCDALDSVPEDVEIPAFLAEVTFAYSIGVKRSKGESPSRAARCGNALSILEAAKAAAESYEFEEPKEGEEESQEDEVNKSALEDFVTSLDEAIEAAQNAEFPGMYG